MIRVVAFDADDTLWLNEVHYKQAEARFTELMLSNGYGGSPMDVLNATEVRNVPLYGFGLKSFTLSMIEAALEIGGDCTTEWIQAILETSKDILKAEVELLPYTLNTLDALSGKYTLMLITKGELFEQERKIRETGVSAYFEHIEILGEKSEQAYQDLLGKHRIDPETFLMVGNSLRSDILPVVAIGGQAVYVPYENTWVYEQVAEETITESNYETIEHLGQLPEVLRRMNSG
jgi:putative hydrolase of the HAD superfamily